MSDPLQFEGKTILVTGASSGIGRATAILLSKLGARVALASRNEQRLRETLDLMQSGPHWIGSWDLADVERIPDRFAQLIDEIGPLDGLVHSAGLASIMPLRSLTAEHLDSLMRINFNAAVWLCKSFCGKRMHRPPASIVLVASLAGLLGLPAQTAYSSSKGALIAFSRSAALELARRNIRVNCVAPGPVQTEMLDVFVRVATAEHPAAQVQTPLGAGTPLDVAHAISFLLAETARWITGSVLVVDGGYSAQ